VKQYLLSARADLVSSTYAPLTEDTLIAFYNIDGSEKAIVIDVESGDYIDLGFPINHLAFNALKRTSDTSFAVIGSTLTAPQSFFHLDITNPDDINVLKASAKVDFPETYFAPTRNIQFSRNHGPGGEYMKFSFLQQTPNTQPPMEPFHP
jgi:hypothetical protein